MFTMVLRPFSWEDFILNLYISHYASDFDQLIMNADIFPEFSSDKHKKNIRKVDKCSQKHLRTCDQLLKSHPHWKPHISSPF